MDKGLKEKLLQDKRVIDEINRHLWIESEKAGYDIGFERASEDWLAKYADEWIKYNAPQWKSSAKKGNGKPKRRRAKSYFK